MAHDHQHEHGEGANARRLAMTLALVLVYIPGPQSGIHGDCCAGIYPVEPGRRPGEASAFGDWLRAFAAERDLPFVDVHAAFLALDAEGDDQPVYEIANGHLNARGNGIVADLVDEALRRSIPR